MKHDSSLVRFSNIESRLVFDYAINLNKNNSINSLTFYHKLATSSCKIDYNKNTFETADIFIDTITGKIYGSLMVEKYKIINDSKTYLMYDGKNYKIGRSINPNKRLLELKTASPNIKLIKECEFIAEKFLHELFCSSNVGGEWFELGYNDLQVCHILMNAKSKLEADMLMRFFHKKMKVSLKFKKSYDDFIDTQKVKVESFINTKIPFGKYKGKKLKEMCDEENIRYLQWLYRVPNLDNVLRYSVKRYLEYKNAL
jgi:hypothetical protein